MDQRSTVEILSSINKTVAQIASYLVPKNKGEESVKKLNKGGGDIVSSPEVSKGGGPKLSPSSADSIKTTVSLIAGITPNINKIASMSGAKMGAFEKVIGQLITTMGKMIEFAEKNKNSMKLLSEFMKSMTDFFMKIPKAMLKMLGSFVLMIPLAPLALIGLILTIPVFLIYGKIVQLLGKMRGITDSAKAMKDMADSIKPMIKFMWSVFGLVTACIVVGALLQIPAVQKSLLYGLAVLGVTLVAMAVIILLTGMAGKLLKGVGAFTALKDMIVFMFATFGLVVACILVGALLQIPAIQNALWYGFGVLIGTLVVMAIIILLAGMAGKLIKNTGAIESLKTMLIVTYASMGLIVASYLLGLFVQDKWGDIVVGLSCAIGVVLLIEGLAWVAGQIGNSGNFKKGLIAMAAIELLCVGAMGIMYMAVDLSEKFLPVWDDVLITLGAVIGVLAVFGALAFGASFILPEVLLGTIAIGSITLMVFLTIKMMERTIEFIKLKDDSGKDWGDIAKDVAGLGLVTAEYGLFGAALGLLVVPMALALPGVLAVTFFASRVMSIVQSTLDLTLAIKDAGGINALTKTVTTDMPELLRGFNAKNYDVPMGLLEMGKLMIKLTALSVLIKVLASSASSFGKIAEIGQMVVGNKIRPVLSVNKETGEITFGEPVDVKNVATVIMDSTKTFVDKCDFGWKDIKKMLATMVVFKIIEQITDPITTFLNMLTSFTCGNQDGTTTLAPVRVDENGNTTIGEPVDVVTVANTIANAVTVFVNTLFSDENATAWADIVYGKQGERETGFFGGTKKSDKFTAMEAMMGLFATVISPIDSFMNVLSQYGTEGGVMYTLKQDENGDWTRDREINVEAVAGGIANAVTIFVNTIFSEENTKKWSDIVYGPEGQRKHEFWSGDTKQSDGFLAAQAMMGVLGDVIGPIGVFMNTISGFKVDNEGIHRVYVDKDGTIKTGEAINVAEIASKIASALSTFTTTIFGQKYDTGGAGMFGNNSIDKISKEMATLTSTFSKFSDLKIDDAEKTVGTMRTVLSILSKPLADDNINIDVINSLSGVSGGVNLFVSAFNKFPGPEKMTGLSDEVTKFSKSMTSSLSSGMFEKMDKFCVETDKMSKSMRELDEAVLKNSTYRTIAFQNFYTQLEKIATILNDRTSDYLSDLATLMSSFSSSDPEKVRLIMEYLKGGAGLNSSSEVNNVNSALDKINDKNVSVNQKGSGVTAESLRDAVASAIDSMRMRPIYEQRLTIDGKRQDVALAYRFEVDS